MEESPIDEWMNRYGWDRNPFNFQIYPDLMIGYEDESRRLRNSIESGSKFTLLLGETGAGKTNMLKNIADEYGGRYPLFYMSKPPVTEENLLTYWIQACLDGGSGPTRSTTSMRRSTGSTTTGSSCLSMRGTRRRPRSWSGSGQLSTISLP
ncbi:MAG: hypothetical protein ABEK12_02785 [Candidatus Nanohaloarchaea archaeon]